MKVVLRCAKVKSGQVSYSHNHNLRKYENENAENVDFERTKLNKIVLGTDETHAKVKENLATLKSSKALRKDANVCLEFIFSASADYFYKDLDKEKFDQLTMKSNKKELNKVFSTLDKEKLADFEKAVLQFIEQDQLFKSNVVNLVLHLDEKTPHYHLLITPIIDHRLTAKEFFTPTNARAWQDRFGELTAHLGLERGQSFSPDVHTTCQDYQSSSAIEIPEPPKVPNVAVKINSIPFSDDKVIVSKSQLLEREKNQGKKYEFYKSYYNENKNTIKKTKQAIAENTIIKKENREMKQQIKKYSDEQLENLRQIPLENVVQSLGYELKKESSNYSRLKTNDINLVINNEKNSFAENIGSKNNFGSINLMTNIFGYSFKQATEYLAQKFGLEQVAREISTDRKNTVAVATYAIEKSLLEMPKPVDRNLEKVVSYLTETRNLSKSIVQEMIDKGQLYADRNNNAVFTNENQTYAYLRGTTATRFVQSKGQMDFITVENTPTPEKIFLFESVIDMLSYRDLNPQEKGKFVSVQGSAMSNKFADLELRKYKQVVCCFDNDEQGQKFVQKVSENCMNMTVEKPKNKDFNDDLAQSRKSVLMEKLNQSPAQATKQDKKLSFGVKKAPVMRL